MPSIRKRIGYLPSINAQKTITKIANREKLSQSKVVGMLVEEALIAREGLDLQRFNELTGKNIYCKENNIDKSTSNHDDIDELISDKGITYNTKKYSYYKDYNLSKSKENLTKIYLNSLNNLFCFGK